MALGLKRNIFLAVGVATGFVPAAAMAQEEPQRNVTVTDRFRADYSPIGMKQGAFLFLPKLDVSQSYDDNISADESATKDDFITTIEPALQVRSQWSQHALNFDANAEIARYASNSDENFENYALGAAGRIDIARDTYLDGGLKFEDRAESRASADDAGGSDPTQYTTLTPNIGLFNRWNRVSLKAAGSARIFDFDDVTTSSGTVIDNDDRDRTEYAASLRIGYEIIPEYEAFVRAEYNQVEYDDGLDSDGVNRNSDGYEVTGGVRIDLTEVLFGDVFVGYRQQNYDDATLNNIDGMTFGGALTWNPSRLTTVKASIKRSVLETTQTTASGNFATGYTVSIDHELLRNVIIGASAGYTVNDYKGIGRDDDDVKAGIYARYLMHRNLYLSASYSHETRDSNVADADYDKNVFLIRLEGQF